MTTAVAFAALFFTLPLSLNDMLKQGYDAIMEYL